MNCTFGEAIERISLLPSKDHRYAIKKMTSYYWVYSNDLRREAHFDFVLKYTTLPYKKEPDQWDNMWEE